MKIKKLLSLLLAVVMVLGLLPVTAMAAGTSLPAAVDGVITLTEDVTLSSTYAVSSGTLTIDLNGYTLKTADVTGSVASPYAKSKSVISLSGSADLTICDSSNGKTGVVVAGSATDSNSWDSVAPTITVDANATGSLTVDGAVVRGGNAINSREINEAIFAGYLTKSEFELNIINGSKIIGGDYERRDVTPETKPNMVCYSSSSLSSLYALATGGATVLISDSEITGTAGTATGSTQHTYFDGGPNFAEGGNALQIGSISNSAKGPGGEVTILRSTITGGSSQIFNAGLGMQIVSKAGKVTITDSTVMGGHASNADNGYGIGGEAMYVGGTVLIQNSDIIGGDGGDSWPGSGMELYSTANVTVEDSLVQGGGPGKGGNYGAAVWCYNAITNPLVAKNSTFKTVDTNCSGIFVGNSGASVTLQCEGKVTMKFGDAMITEDDINNSSLNLTIANPENLQPYQGAAKIGEQGYLTLAEAVNEANSGDTIVLLEDSSDNVTLAAGVSFDTNGCAYTGAITAGSNALIQVSGTKYIAHNTTDLGQTLTSGTYLSDPSAYVADGHAAIKTTGANGAAFYNVYAKVSTGEGEEGSTDVVVEDHSATVPPVTPDTDGSGSDAPAISQEAADQVNDAIAHSPVSVEMQPAAPESAGAQTSSSAYDDPGLQAAVAQAAATADDHVEAGKDVTIVVTPKVDVEVVAAETQPVSDEPDAEHVLTSVTYDVEASYVITAQDETGAPVEVADGKTSIEVPLKETTTPITMRLPVPADWYVADGDNTVYITHTKDDGSEYIYEGTVVQENGETFVLFDNLHGYSLFSVTRTVAFKATVGDQNYATLQAAVDAAEAGDTITVVVNEDATEAAKTAVIDKDLIIVSNAALNITTKNGYVLQETTRGYKVYNPTAGLHPGILDPVSVFWDVQLGDWFYGDVEFVYTNGLMSGTAPDTFGPNAGLTRAMVWTILARLDGQSTRFGATWYSAGQTWAMQNGISDGTDPMGMVSREQLAAMLMRYADFKGNDVSTAANLAGFADAGSVSGYAVSAMQWAVGEGIINGADNKLLPQSGATRAQAAAMFHRFCLLLGA